MIMWFFFLILSLSSMFFGRSVINLIMIILSMSTCLMALFFYKGGSMLALMWILVYLGGMMVCFVYILFMVDSKGGPITIPPYQSSFLINSTTFLILVCKVSFLLSVSNLYQNFQSPLSMWAMIFSETYLQLITLSPLSFLLLSLILTSSLIQILSSLLLKTKAQNGYLL